MVIAFLTSELVSNFHTRWELIIERNEGLTVLNDIVNGSASIINYSLIATFVITGI